MRKSLVFFERLMAPSAYEVFDAAADVDLTSLSFDQDEREIWRALEGAHGYHAQPAMETPAQWFPGRDFIERCPNVLAMGSTGAGYDIIDVAACTEKGILVVNNTGGNAVSVAQHVIGFALALSKQMAQSDKAHRRDDAIERGPFVGSELTDKVMGIIGLGNIGRLVAGYAKVFGMRVIACDPYIADADFAERGAEKVDFETLFREADFVSVNCPKNSETIGMVDARAFSLMKSKAYFITTARGGIHDEGALLAALREKRVQGAGLDVHAVEPTGRGNPLVDFENVLITPHNAGVTFESRNNMARMAAEQWLAIFRGEIPPRLINPEAWDKYCGRYESIMGRAAAE
ncbi:MAG: hydroxyacid dehydrogenase [Rhodospirillaceae bacterium]